MDNSAGQAAVADERAPAVRGLTLWSAMAGGAFCSLVALPIDVALFWIIFGLPGDFWEHLGDLLLWLSIPTAFGFAITNWTVGRTLPMTNLQIRRITLMGWGISLSYSLGIAIATHYHIAPIFFDDLLHIDLANLAVRICVLLFRCILIAILCFLLVQQRQFVRLVWFRRLRRRRRSPAS